jgi:phosphopantothenoylcysteine synthetase/decarboxylase
MTNARRVVYVIGFSAPPVLHLDELLVMLDERVWDSYVILSPTAATWVDLDRLAKASGHPVRVEPRTPAEQDPLPPADAVVAAPITFNSLNKWAAGISDTLALGILNESLGLPMPVTAAPCIKSALRAHPAYRSSTRILEDVGVRILDPEHLVSRGPDGLAVLGWPLIVSSVVG